MLEKIQTWLTEERRPALLYAVAAMIGLGFSWYLLTWDGINGTSEYWSTTHNDSVQSIAALRYYVSEGWAWPVFDVAGYGYPEGTSLILADSIPLLAVLAKLGSSVLPEGFHYFGYWVALCFVIQAVAVVALAAVFGFRSIAVAVAGSGFAVLQTVLLTRFFHAALMGQFLIVLAIIIGIRTARGERPYAQLGWSALLLAITFLVHPYLFAMVAVVSGAFVLQAGVRDRLPWRVIGIWSASAAGGAIALVALTGIAGAVRSDVGGFGFYSLNLLSLVAKRPDATGGQYEGFSYLGLGVIGLLLVNLYVSRDLIARLVREYWVPVAAAVLMAVFALSPSIWIGDTSLVEFSLPPLDWLGERFRASGRFVWPLVYMLLASALLLTLRRFRPRVAAALLIGALAIQVLDLSGTVRGTRDAFTTSERSHLDRAAWIPLIEGHSLVRMTPHECVVGTGVKSFASREVQRLAGEARVPITTAATARRGEDCDTPEFDHPLVPGEVRVVWSDGDDFYRIAGSGGGCVDITLGTVCTLQELDPEDLDSLSADITGVDPGEVSSRYRRPT